MTANARAVRPARNVLTILAVLLIGSAVVRIGAGGGFALAANPESGTLTQIEPKGPDSDVTPKLLALLESLREREAALQERTVAMEARMQVLQRAEAQIAEDLAQLQDAEAKLRATIADVNAAAASDIDQLTAVYENMKAEQAAELFSRMEPSFAAGFLGRMRSDSAAAILAGLEPDLAYSISVVLAGRNADLPVETLEQ